MPESPIPVESSPKTTGVNTLVTEHLPPNCFYKSTILGTLLEGVPSELALESVQEVVSHPSGIRKYRALVKQGTSPKLPSGRYNPRCPPRKPEVSESEERKMLEFVKAHCPTPSGSKKEKYIQLKGRLDLYADYIQWCIKNALQPRSYPVFLKFLLKFNVRALSCWYGHFSCPHCFKSEKGLIDKVDKAQSEKEKNAARRELEDWRKHQFVKPHQRQVYEHRLRSLRPIHSSCHALLIVDFTCLEPESRNNTRIQNMILVVVFKDMTDQEQRLYFDFLCGDAESRKNDFFFVRRVFELFLSDIRTDPALPDLRHIKSVQIWSDGGRKHFKNRFTMTDVPSLFRNAGVSLSWSFFAAYHGANLCDSHAGVEGQHNKRLSSQDHPNLTAEMFGASYTSLSNTYPVVLTSIPRFKFDATELKGISEFYHFEFPGESAS